VLCCATILLCLSDAKRVHSLAVPLGGPTLDPRGNDGRSLDSLVTVGRKAARCYSIPSLALYGLPSGPTKRGLTSCSQSHTNGLYDIEKEIRGCPFWDEALSNFQRNGVWVSDDAMEAFYDEFFPDDIPDEWSHQEKLKSHGQGLLNAGDTMTRQRMARIHMSKPCRLAFWPICNPLDCNPEDCSLLVGIHMKYTSITTNPVTRVFVC